MAFSANNNPPFQSSIQASMSSLFSSLRPSQPSPSNIDPFPTGTSPGPVTPTAVAPKTSEDSSTGKSSVKATVASHPSSPLASDVAGATSAASPTGSTIQTSYTSDAASAANSNGSGPLVLSESEQCTSISCSSSLKAAVAVPVALVCLGLIIALIFMARRRRKREKHDDDSSQVDGQPTTASKWTRHLRVFSFDAELLMGARSSNNSLHSGMASGESIRSQPRTVRSNRPPSMRSLESPAPPYRDAVFPLPPMAERPASVSTAPPAYVPPFSRDRPGSRLSVVSRPSTVSSDPFADPDDPVSPMRGQSAASTNPPADADTQSLISTMHESEDGGSVREAQIATLVTGEKRRLNDLRNSP